MLKQEATTLKAALIQTHLRWENPLANRASLSSKITGLPEDVDMVILPEMFTTAFTMSPSNIPIEEAPTTLDWMKDLAKSKDALVMGSIVWPEKGEYTNRLLAVLPDGSYHYYDKRHTFTYAGEHKNYKSGNSRLIFEYKGFKICPLICYDLRFPVWSRNTEDYDVLVYVANWPIARINAWDALLKARAIENLSYCIGVNRIGLDGLGFEYNGHSAANDPLGNRLVYSDKEETLLVELKMNNLKKIREKLKFLDDRDQFQLI